MKYLYLILAILFIVGSIRGQEKKDINENVSPFAKEMIIEKSELINGELVKLSINLFNDKNDHNYLTYSSEVNINGKIETIKYVYFQPKIEIKLYKNNTLILNKIISKNDFPNKIPGFDILIPFEVSFVKVVKNGFIFICRFIVPETDGDYNAQLLVSTDGKIFIQNWPKKNKSTELI